MMIPALAPSDILSKKFLSERIETTPENSSKTFLDISR